MLSEWMGQSALRTTDFRPEARHNTDLETRRDPDHPLLMRTSIELRVSEVKTVCFYAFDNHSI